MTRLALRFVSALLLVLVLAPAASAEQWTAARYIDTPGSLSSPNQFDSVLYFVSVGWATVHIYLYNESGTPLLSATNQFVCNPCSITFNGYTRFRIQDQVVATGGFPAGPFVSGPIRVTASVPLANLNPTLFVSNSDDGAFDVQFAIDHGKILP